MVTSGVAFLDSTPLYSFSHCLAGRLRRDRRRHGARIHRQRGGIAGHAPCRAAHHHLELRPVVRRGRRRRRVAGRHRSADGRAILLPLVAQMAQCPWPPRRVAVCPTVYRPVGRLRADRWRHRRQILTGDSSTAPGTRYLQSQFREARKKKSHSSDF